MSEDEVPMEVEEVVVGVEEDSVISVVEEGSMIVVTVEDEGIREVTIDVMGC